MGLPVDFVDIDPLTYNMSVEALRQKLEAAEWSGTLPKVVVPVDFSGQSAEMAEIAALGRKYGFRIVEDASHAIGGSYQGRKIGSCAHADITVFSFHPVKIITTGEGGMVGSLCPSLGASTSNVGSTFDPPSSARNPNKFRREIK